MNGSPPGPPTDNVPPLADDCFAAPGGLTPVDDALARLAARLHPVTPAEQVALAAGDGRILAADLVAARAHPAAANSAVDGYALRRADLAGPGPYALALAPGRAAAGDAPGVLPPGRALRILTGALIPEGADAVVMQEDVARDPAGGQIRLGRGLKPGANIRPAGEDVAGGATVLSAGHQLRPQDLALAAACGLDALPVRRRLRVAVLSTGDELLAPGAPARPGQLHDSNRPMLLALLARWGMEPVDIGTVPDDPAAVAAALDRAAGTADAVLTSGGASAGDEDHVSAALGRAGTLDTWRIAMKPGRPLALGLWDGVPVFGLPGNPVATLVTACIFARPALRRMAGAGWSLPAGLMLPAGFARDKRAGRREYLRARIRDGVVEPFVSEGSGRISGLSWAEGLCVLPDDATTVRAGAPVRFHPWGEFGL